MQQTDKQDLIIYGVLGLSFLGLLLFKSGDLIAGLNAQSLVSRNAQSTAKDDTIAQRRFGQGCNTGFLVAGESILAPTEQALDIRTQRPLSPGSVLCDETGATAIVDRDGYPSDIRVSAKVRKTYQEKAFRNENLKTTQEAK